MEADTIAYEIAFVPLEHTVEVWPKIRGYMKKAADYTHGRYDVDDILTAILSGGFQLWLAYRSDTKEIDGAVVTFIRQYPKGNYLDLTFIGGNSGTGFGWKDEMLAVLRKWARDNGCKEMESAGRPGWSRIFGKDGYRTLWHTYGLPVEEEA